RALGGRAGGQRRIANARRTRGAEGAAGDARGTEAAPVGTRCRPRRRRGRALVCSRAHRRAHRRRRSAASALQGARRSDDVQSPSESGGTCLVNIETSEAVYLEDAGTLSIAQLIERSGLSEDELRALVECGALA